MLSYISAKFAQPPENSGHEPRAALFLNRFTRTLPIMFATNGLQRILGISADELRSKSFYYCIQENCLPEAIRCLESAKANDSIAYLRFWYRDPREDDEAADDPSEAPSSDLDDDEDGGVQLNTNHETDSSDYAVQSASSGFNSSRERRPPLRSRNSMHTSAETSTGSSTSGANPSAIFDQTGEQSSSSSLPGTADPHDNQNRRRETELEAVISCTSDGLVVILREARPYAMDTVRSRPNGVFASPWASEPILPVPARMQSGQVNPVYSPSGVPVWEQSPNVARDFLPGPPVDDFMNSIREVAVFAWALVGINGSLEQYGRGQPIHRAQPPDGAHIWDPPASYPDDVQMSGA
jgi:hypothetical protein